MSSDRKTGNPAYLTLTVWAVFNGDTLGASPSDAFEAYIRRFTSDISNARQALEQLAVQMSLSGVPFIERKQAGKFVSQYEDSSAITDLDSNTENPSSMLGDDTEDELDLVAEDMRELDDLEIPAAPSENAKLDRPVSARKVRRMLPEMVKNRILKYRGDSTISFSHSIIGGYLAGCGLSSLGGEQELIRQSDWPGKKIPFLFLSGKKDVSYLIDQFITDTRDDTLRNRLVTIGTWPSISKGKSPWRGKVMRKLATSINESNLPIGVRAQAVAALALSGEAGVARLFRQLMTSPREDLQMLAAIGAGLVQDSKALEQLNELQYCPYPSVRRSACLALVAIGSGESIEMAAAALLHGEDDVRRTAAEALAVHPLDGHAMLKEGAELDDLAVRRAITYGLGRIDEEWARELLERMQLEDEQWIVRTTAGQVLETQDKQSSILYSSLGELSETPWLVTFASEQGMGLSPGEASWNMLVRALRDGNQDQKLAAMDVYRQNPNEAGKVIPIIVDLMGGRDGEIREAAYQTLWQVSRYGVEVH